MRKAMDQPGLGIGWKNDKRLTDLDFANDIALVAKQARPVSRSRSRKNRAEKCPSRAEPDFV